MAFFAHFDRRIALKKAWVLISVMFVMLFSACATQTEYSIIQGAETFVVDKAEGTISCGDAVYQYEIKGSRITITYPNGSEYWWVQEELSGYGGWSDDYDAEEYHPGQDLVDALASEIPDQKEARNILPSLILVAVGIWSAISPSSSWYVSYGWRYKNAEPSDVALGVLRAGGVLAVIVGIVLLFL